MEDSGLGPVDKDTQDTQDELDACMTRIMLKKITYPEYKPYKENIYVRAFPLVLLLLMVSLAIGWIGFFIKVLFR